MIIKSGANTNVEDFQIPEKANKLCWQNLFPLSSLFQVPDWLKETQEVNIEFSCTAQT